MQKLSKDFLNGKKTVKIAKKIKRAVLVSGDYKLPKLKVEGLQITETQD